MARLSVHVRTRTSRGSNPSRDLTYTVGRPDASKTACRGMNRALSSDGPAIAGDGEEFHVDFHVAVILYVTVRSPL